MNMTSSGDDDHLYHACAEVLKQADGLLITAGAGMGVDSGLPDFRGPGGFWKHYPALRKENVLFQDIASPQAFHDNPKRAWGFYGHRLRLYRTTIPHRGFRILQHMAEAMPCGAFVFTSNVDGQFQKAGFPDEKLVDVHGSIHHLQCLAACGPLVWPADAVEPVIDETRCELLSELPACPRCGGVARPNILMFDDWSFSDLRRTAKAKALNQWLERVRRPVVVEIGAGNDIPTVRRFGEAAGGTLIRINPEDQPMHRGRVIRLRTTGLAALQRLEKLSEPFASNSRGRVADA